MKFVDLIAPERIVLGLRAGDKPQLLMELAKRAAALLPGDSQAILASLEAREKLGSTGVGRGLALPHARLAGVSTFFSLFVRLARPIDFDAIDSKPVDIVVLLLTPADGGEHVAALAAIARALRNETTLQEVRRAENAAALFQQIRAAAP